MIWKFVVPGNAVSVNDAYRTGKMPLARKGKPVLGPDGSQRFIHRPILTDQAEQWRNDVQLIAQNARPKGWQWSGGRIRIVWRFHLTRLTDSDNLLKLACDGLSRAIGVNDKFFNHCIEDVIVVKDSRESRTEVIVSTDPTCRCFLLAERQDAT